MKKKWLKITEIFLIFIIIFICFVSVLQSSFLHDKKIFGYNVYMINSGETLNEGDIILVKDIEFKIGDIVVYKEKEEFNTDKIVDFDNDKIFLNKDKHINKKQIVGVYKYHLSFISIISKIIKDKTWFVICLLFPFSLLVVLEVINICKNSKNKKINVIEDLELNNINTNNLQEEIDKSIDINLSKKKKKKLVDLEQTIQLPIEEIHKKISLEKKEDTVSDDTMILFTKDDIKEVIKKELKSIDNK